MTAVEYIELCAGRADLMTRVAARTADFDALVMPTVAITAPPVAAFAPDEDYFRLNALILRNTSVINFLDRCAVTLPIHPPDDFLHTVWCRSDASLDCIRHFRSNGTTRSGPPSEERCEIGLGNSPVRARWRMPGRNVGANAQTVVKPFCTKNAVADRPNIGVPISAISDGRHKPGDPGGRRAMAKEILCGFGIDVDAVAGWLGSYGGEDSPDDISRGLFAGEVGSPRLLKLFARLGIKTTWFIPGHSIETFPAEMKAVAEAGHEIGIHGYSHENPIAMTREQEMAVLDKCIELVTQLSGKSPTGYVAPWWEFSTVTNELLLERGIKYDHSLMHHDHRPYYVRVGDSWTKIDYSKQPREWMVPLQRGQETDLIEIPASWYLDDLPPMLFIKKSPNSHGFVNPRDIEQMWRDQFDWVYREYDYAVFPITIHPDVSGRPHVLIMLERLYHHMIGHPGVRFVTMNEMADDFARRSPRTR
jgi:peptidoglycan/xylan/chitin deacetylase (PgdA/CDA1 family)